MIDTRRTALVPRRGSAPEAPFQLGFFGCLFCIRKKKGGGGGAFTEAARLIKRASETSRPAQRNVNVATNPIFKSNILVSFEYLHEPPAVPVEIYLSSRSSLTLAMATVQL